MASGAVAEVAARTGSPGALAGALPDGDLLVPAGWRLSPGLLGALAMAAFGLAVAAVPGSSGLARVLGVWLAASFAGVAGVALVVARRAPASYLLGGDGIHFPAQRWPSIPWEDVADARIVSVLGRRLLAVDLIDPEAIHPGSGHLGQRVLQLNQRRGRGFLSIPEEPCPWPLGVLEAELAARIAAARTGSPQRRTAAGGRPRLRRRLLLAAELPEAAVLGHGALEFLMLLRGHPAGAAGPTVALALVLVAAGLLVHYRPAIGVPVVVVLEAACVALALAAGAHVTAGSRMLTTLFPLCVLVAVISQSAQR
jgi:hypothetical protein